MIYAAIPLVCILLKDGGSLLLLPLDVSSKKCIQFYNSLPSFSSGPIIWVYRYFLFWTE